MRQRLRRPLAGSPSAWCRRKGNSFVPASSASAATFPPACAPATKPFCLLSRPPHLAGPNTRAHPPRILLRLFQRTPVVPQLCDRPRDMPPRRANQTLLPAAAVLPTVDEPLAPRSLPLPGALCPRRGRPSALHGVQRATQPCLPERQPHSWETLDKPAQWPDWPQHASRRDMQGLSAQRRGTDGSGCARHREADTRDRRKVAPC